MNFFRRKTRRGTTLTFSDQTNPSKGSLSSGDGRGSSQGSIGTSKKSATGLYSQDPTSEVQENASIDGSIKLAGKIKQTQFSNDTNENNNSSVFDDRLKLARTNESYLRTDYRGNGQPMALLGHHGPNLNQELPSESTSSGAPMALYASVIKGDKTELKKIITANPALLDTADNFGRTPLMYCVLAERLDCAKFLINMGCDLDQVDNAGRSATHSAAHKGSYKFLELLHNRGASLDIKDNDGQAPLHLATRIRTPKCVEFLLRNLGPGMVDIPDNQMRTALHWSAAFNNTECVKLLIKYGINIALTDAECKTPLHWAANNHDPATVNTMAALLEKSPSVLNWQDNEGRTALHFAAAHGNSVAVEFLVNFKAVEFSEPFECDPDRSDYTYRTPLHWAAQLGHTHIVKLLLQGKARISSSDGNGATPFLYAALTDKHTVVEAMIEHDPKVVEQADIEGRTALMWAAGKGSNNVMRILLGIKKVHEFDDANGQNAESVHKAPKNDTKLSFTPVDVNKHDNKGNTAVHVAAKNGHGSSVELLLKHGARHDIQNTEMHHTPIFGACEKGHLNCVTYLLDYKASINIFDSENRAPLHWAALGGHAEVCELLIKEGLDVDVRDKLERTPLHCAAFGGFINCMNLLLENGATVDLQDQEGRSALHWAAQSGHLDAIKLLFQYSVFPNPMEYTEERLTPLDHALLKENEDVMHYLIEQGAMSAEHIRNIAAMRIQAYFRGFKVRRQSKILMKTLLLRKEKREKIEAEMEEKSAEQVRHAAATKIQARCRGYLVRKTSLTRQLELPIEKADIDHEKETEVERNKKSDSEKNDDSGSYSPESVLVTASNSAADMHPAKQTNVSHDEGVICDNVSVASSHSFLPIGAKVDKTDIGKKEKEAGKEEVEKSQMEGKGIEENLSEAIESTEDEIEGSLPVCKFCQPAIVIVDDSLPPTKHVASDDAKSTKRRKTRKARSKATSRPEILDSDSSKDVTTMRETSSSSMSSSPLSLRSMASPWKSPVKVADPVGNATRSQPKPPPEPKNKNRRRKRLVQTKTAERELSYPGLDKIGDETNIQAQTVRGIAYKSCPQDVAYYSDELNLVQECTIKTSTSLDLSEYIESLMTLSPTERKLLVEHQNQRRDAFRVANRAALIIQKAWLRYLKKRNPSLHRKFLATQKKAIKQRKPSRHTESNATKTSNHRHVNKKSMEQHHVPPEDQFEQDRSHGDAMKMPSSRTIAPSVASSSATSLARTRSMRSEAARSSLLSSCEIGSSSTARKSSKTRRPKTSSQSSVYISLERLEDLSRIYGNPKLVRDLLANSGRSNTNFPSITSSMIKSSSSMKRPVTVSETPRQIFESSLKGTSAYSQPVTAMHSPRVWSGLPGVHKQTGLTSTPRTRSYPSSRNRPSNQNVDYRLMPLQWQKLYGELQDTNAADARRKHAIRYSYNLGEIS